MPEYTAIIPAAGKGVRLMPYTAHMPKTMISVAGKPILGHILDEVESLGIKKAVIVVGYKKEAIEAFVSSHYPQLDVTLVPQTELKGLGHAIYMAKEVVQGPCFILLGDTIVQGDLRPFVSGTQNALGVLPVPDPERFGVVELKDGNIVSLEEKPQKPKSNLSLIGVYSVLDSAQLFDALGAVIRSGKRVNNEIQLTDAFSVMLNRKIPLSPVAVTDWFDCGTVETLLDTNRMLSARKPHIPADIAPNNTIIPPCVIADGAKLTNCTVGPYVSVSYGAELTDCLLEDCVVGPETKLHKKTAFHAVFDKYNP